jgi:Ca2+-binding RTX toxin-like protein
MRGGTGDDSYVVEQAGDRVIEAGGQGTDTVSSSIGYTLPVHVENLILTGAAALDGTGNGHANQLVGNGAGNVLDGRGGVDTMRGAAGDDTYIVDNIGDRVVELASQGTDTVRSSVNYTLSDNVENLALTDAGIINGTGNSRANVISGNAKANVLDGAGGADAMRGGKGHDTYVVENAADQVIERADEGTDTIRSYVSYVLPDHVEALGLGGAGVTNATGNGLTNRLYGNAKANVLDGAGGADTMKGRSGHDIYHVDHANDSVVEVHGEGSDTVRAWVSYTLANHVENLVLTGAAAINGTGNGHGNQLIGNSAANLLDGARGKDLMRGGHGNDTYIVDHSADSVVELAGQGIDRVRSSVSHTLSQHVENLSLEGSAEINGTGNALANQLTGNRAKNLLDGGSGADVMRGGFGNDTYVVDVAGDQVIELANEGWDRVKSAISYTLGDNLEGLALTGQAAINGTGNALANKIVGNRGANILDGRGGADVMQGGVGNDIYVVDHAGDQVIEADGGGVDTVKSSVSFSLADQYADNLTLTGSAAIDGTGNALANRLVGNGAANVLNGAGGEDRIRGGGGSDSFLFTARPSAANAAQIEDFVAGDDRILLGGLAGQPFEALASGALGAHAFRTGTAAADADDRIIYNRSTGQLSFDADGAGGADAVRFAILEPGLSLTAGDFLVTGPANRLPTFSSGASASIAENSAASTIVYQARASDPDGDAIAYALSGRDAGLFTIDASGAVRLIAPADYESRTSYSLTAIARDSGPTAVTRDVAVNVTNVADVGATPILNETTRQNGGFESAQAVERLLLRPSNNSSLWNDDLPSVTIRGNISAPGDADFFSITLQKDEMLVLDVDFSEGDLDALIKVYHPITGAPLVVEDDLVVPDPGSAPHPEYGHNTDPLVRFRAPQAGTYLFSIEAFQDAANPTSGSYHLNVSVGPFVSEAELHEENIQAMLSGTSWSRIFVTYGFPTREADYARGEWEEEIAAGMEALNLQQQRAVRTIVDGIADLTNLDFYMGSPETADLRYALSNSPETAFAAYPGPGIGGDSWYNRLDYGSPKAGNYDWLGFLHETGHALGLKHPHEAPAVSIDRDMLAYTVMSYRSFATAPLDETGGYTNETWGFPQTYMMYDIAALQRLYGADFTFNSANTTYRWNPDTGAFMIDGEVEWTPGANRVFMTIWDGGGTDTYDLSNYKTNTLIDLRPGQWSRTSDDQLANTGSPNGHWPPGNVANALQFNGDTRSLIENAVGGSGWDWLIANQTANRLTGGAGRDRFVWNSIDDSRPGQADTITDFKRFDDLIDLEMIDADTSTPSDDLFQFIGSNAFSGRAGELRYAAGGNGLRLLGDVDGDGAADLEIVVANQTTLTAVDFQF